MRWIVATLFALSLGGLSLGGLSLAVPAVAAPGLTGEVVLDGRTRAGRPVVVRIAGAVRARSAGTPWATPRGVARDEFVLFDAHPDGQILVVDAESAETGEIESLRLEVRPLPTNVPAVALLDDPPAQVGSPPDPIPGGVRVRAENLPTVAEAWFVFDDVQRVPDGLGSAEVSALAEWRLRAKSPLEPILWEPSPHAWRAMSAIAARAPTLTPDVSRALHILAATLVALILLVARSRKPSPTVRAAWVIVPALLASGWLLIGDRLPGPMRAHSTFMVGDGGGVLVVRVHALRDGAATLLAPGAVPLRWEAGDSATSGLTIGDATTVELEAGSTRLLAFPWSIGSEVTTRASHPPFPAEAEAWTHELGGNAGGDSSSTLIAAPLRARGTRVVAVEGWEFY